jgi:Cu/Ag efflux pump CusA
MTTLTTVIGGQMVSTFFTLIPIPTLYVMFEERFPRTITPIEDDGAPPRREAPAQ